MRAVWRIQSRWPLLHRLPQRSTPSCRSRLPGLRHPLARSRYLRPLFASPARFHTHRCGFPLRVPAGQHDQIIEIRRTPDPHRFPGRCTGFPRVGPPGCHPCPAAASGTPARTRLQSVPSARCTHRPHATVATPCTGHPPPVAWLPSPPAPDTAGCEPGTTLPAPR